MPEQNNRETGARKLMEKRFPDANEDFSQEAAGNNLPPSGVGNTEAVGDVDEKTRHSDGRQPEAQQIKPPIKKPDEKDRPL